MERPIDRALSQRRQSKEIVRRYWVDECREHDLHIAGRAVPLYLTLPGSEGLDIQLLAASGLVDLTEVGGIALHHKNKVVAVERSPAAVLALQEQLPGLWILEMEVMSLLHGPTPFHWPDSTEHITACRALVVNLDFNTSIGRPTSGSLSFPLFAAVAKFSQLHAMDPVVDRWTLLLTLNAHTDFDRNVWESIVDFIAANLAEVPEFRANCISAMGSETIAAIEARDIGVANDPLSRGRLLMAFVPKRVADVCRAQGWRTATVKTFQYPGAGGSAGMLSWIVRFEWDNRTAEDPLGTYRMSVATIMQDVEILEG